LAQADVQFNGHAIEFRINAENPWDGFRPSSGRLGPHFFDADRQDAGFEAGDSIPPQYDSLIAKLIFRGADRSAALAAARDGLVRGEWLGVRSNLNLHAAILREPQFIAGGASVDWLEAHLDDILAAGSAAPEWWAAAGGALLRRARTGRHGVAVSSATLGWIGAESPGCWLDDGAVTKWVRPGTAAHDATHATVDGVDVPFTVAGNSELARVGAASERLNTTRYGNEVAVSEAGDDGDSWQFRIVPPPPMPRRAQTATSGATAITAPLSGTIAAVRVEEGDAVEAGALLVLLEAMKMEHRIIAPSAGTVKVVSVHESDVVADGQVLVELG
jgi:acetyl/propionyl-CoA carboxylase alpha subunit